MTVTPEQAVELLNAVPPLMRLFQVELWDDGVELGKAEAVPIVQALLDAGQATNVKQQMVQRIGVTHTDAVARWADIMARLHVAASNMGILP